MEFLHRAFTIAFLCILDLSRHPDKADTEPKWMEERGKIAERDEQRRHAPFPRDGS